MAVEVRLAFERFVGIDWSGAKGPYLKGLKVAVCEQGASPPKLIPPASGGDWPREELIRWVIEVAANQRILVGADFGFAYPCLDKGAYFPEHPESPKSALTLWQTVEKSCSNEPDFYAGPFYRSPDAPFLEYLHYPGYKGSRFSHRRRRTECAVASIHATPACMFKCLGPNQVGVGSASGMRVLNFLATNHNKILSIWPFDSAVEGKSILVEIFPRLFFTLADRNPQKWRDIATVNAVLKHFGSGPLPLGTTIDSKDEADAIVSAAALRFLSCSAGVWHPQGLDEETQRLEGWIFGCP